MAENENNNDSEISNNCVLTVKNCQKICRRVPKFMQQMNTEMWLYDKQ